MLAVILNPRARGGKAARLWTEFLATSEATRLGVVGSPVFDGEGATDAKDLRRRLDAWLRARLAAGRTRFLAAGGDGTVHLAVNALAAVEGGQRARLGAVGLGSSNDFHKPFDALGRSRVAGLPCRLAFENAVSHDLGEVELDSPSGGQKIRFAVNASVGLTAEANHYFNTAGAAFGALKRASVNAAICAAAVRQLVRFRPVPLRISRDGELAREAAVVNLGVVKNPHFSGNFRYEVAQAPDDGLFGVHLCEGMGRAGALRTMARLARGRFSGQPGTSSKTAREVEVTSLRPFAVETDGEVRRTSVAHFRVLPGEIALCP